MLDEKESVGERSDDRMWPRKQLILLEERGRIVNPRVVKRGSKGLLREPTENELGGPVETPKKFSVQWEPKSEKTLEKINKGFAGHTVTGGDITTAASDATVESCRVVLKTHLLVFMGPLLAPEPVPGT